MFSRFKTLKDILTAKNLAGDDAIAQRATVAIQAIIELKMRAYHAGHLGAYMACDDMLAYASLALGGLDRTHRYAFLDDLKVDVRQLAAANGHLEVGTDKADELVTHAEALYAALDAEVPVPSVIIEGIDYPRILRGHHCDQALAAMRPINDNAGGPRLV